MKKIIFYCQTNYRASLVDALLYLRVLNKEEINFKSLKELAWWPRINRLKPGQILEIGRDEKGNKVYILSTPKEAKLLPKIVRSFFYELKGKRNLLLKEAMPSTNSWIEIGRIFTLGGSSNSLSHYFFLRGFLKLLKQK